VDAATHVDTTAEVGTPTTDVTAEVRATGEVSAARFSCPRQRGKSKGREGGTEEEWKPASHLSSAFRRSAADLKAAAGSIWSVGRPFWSGRL